ncbi:MAG: type I-U CRISPR-associated protein Cas7 [Planctomycetes bacterium]|nr:type I-U CRISPR-associated protein Cas7 [Planctomycetota bacterium]
MPLDLSSLNDAARLLVNGELDVALGGGRRFQPTGFPDLGPALFKDVDGETDWLLVESVQSVANRLEAACWDDAEEHYDVTCDRIPFVRSEINLGGRLRTTSTPQEAHRLASPYILAGNITFTPQAQSQNPPQSPQPVTEPLWQRLRSTSGPLAMRLEDDVPFRLRNHAGQLFQFDPGSLLHGAWLSTKVVPAGNSKSALCGGKVRFPRVISGFVEAKNPRTAQSGGVKRERIRDQSEEGADAESGFGSVPFPRTDFTSGEIFARFNLDLSLLRTLALGTWVQQQVNGQNQRSPQSPLLQAPAQQGMFTNEEAFLVTWAIYKIQRFLSHGLSLRSGCQFVLKRITVEGPAGFTWPTETDVTTALTTLKDGLFPQHPGSQGWVARNVTTVNWEG